MACLNEQTKVLCFSGLRAYKKPVLHCKSFMYVLLFSLHFLHFSFLKAGSNVFVFPQIQAFFFPAFPKGIIQWVLNKINKNMFFRVPHLTKLKKNKPPNLPTNSLRRRRVAKTLTLIRQALRKDLKRLTLKEQKEKLKIK